MKIATVVLLVLLFSYCSINKSYTLIPPGFEYPNSKIKSGKIFTYINSVTRAKTFENYKLITVDGRNYLTTKTYNANSTGDSIVSSKGKRIERYNYFIEEKNAPIKASILKDTVISYNKELRKLIIIEEYKTKTLINKVTTEERLLKDTTIFWKKEFVQCVVILANSRVEFRLNKDSVSFHNIDVTSQLYFGKNIGLIRYSIHFIDHNGIDNFNIWQLESIENLNNKSLVPVNRK